MYATMEQLLTAAGKLAHERAVQQPRKQDQELNVVLGDIDVHLRQQGKTPGDLIVSCPIKLLPAVLLFAMSKGASEQAIMNRLAQRVMVRLPEPEVYNREKYNKYTPGWSIPVQIRSGERGVIGTLVVSRIGPDAKYFSLMGPYGDFLTVNPKQEYKITNERLCALETVQGTRIVVSQPGGNRVSTKFTITNPAV